MKKVIQIVLGVFIGLILVIVAVPLILVGIEKITSGSPVDVEDYAGTYLGVSAFDTSLVLSGNETFDLYENGEVLESGTVSSNESNTLRLGVSDNRGGTLITDYKFDESGQYLYRESGSRPLAGAINTSFTEDVDYGQEPAFDENGRCNQTFRAEYTSNDIITLQLNEDGTYIIAHSDGISSNIDIDYQGTYNLENDLLTLEYEGGELIFVYTEGDSGNAIYFDVYEKQE